MKRTIAIVVMGLSLLISATSCRAQKCPNWSPKFDKITNPDVIAQLKAMNWDKAIADAGGPEQLIASMKVTRKDAQQRLETADHNAEAIKAGPGPVKYDATWDQCKNNGGAYQASKCEHLVLTEMILYLDGSIELLKCRQDQK